MSTTDEENTMRALRNDPLIMKLRCRIGLHKWSIWSIDETVPGKRDYPDHYSQHAFRKTCVLCNTPKWKTVRKPFFG